MSQAQPTPRSNREAAARGAAAITDLTRRRRQQRASKALGPPVDGNQARPGKATVAEVQTGAASGRRRPPLLAFGLGAVLGYALAGPLPHWITPVVAGLKQGSSSVTSLINPLAQQRRILVLGTDAVSGSTDVMLTVQVKDGTTELTQVPRDTYIETPDFGVQKANALYALGGPEAVKRELTQLLDAPVDHYLKVNLRAVQRLADALDGVELDVPKRMYYVDNSQGLYIDLYPGVQVLKGENLEGFLRFRHDELGDIGRLERQKLVLSAVFRKLVQPGTVTRLPELLRIAGDDIRTDLSPVDLARLMGSMATTRLKTEQLPGHLYWYNDLSYWMPETGAGQGGQDGAAADGTSEGVRAAAEFQPSGESRY
ncbi:LCP family protein [Synechococcus sp. CBW1002]|jgi:LCP family protein required for cell wall assembly|uniref:LCP family protein n=1 Tax=Synechococcus sp. CBW1002 TaxID=1353134 RepID=UPI0018CCA9AC|nr:LCP family protein [Synechococcus sp. CBW1002]QPN60818.1 LCP family protein [Synechococcus sp. CBW1002]